MKECRLFSRVRPSHVTYYSTPTCSSCDQSAPRLRVGFRMKGGGRVAADIATRLSDFADASASSNMSNDACYSSEHGTHLFK